MLLGKGLLHCCWSLLLAQLLTSCLQLIGSLQLRRRFGLQTSMVLCCAGRLHLSLSLLCSCCPFLQPRLHLCCAAWYSHRLASRRCCTTGMAGSLQLRAKVPAACPLGVKLLLQAADLSPQICNPARPGCLQLRLQLLAPQLLACQLLLQGSHSCLQLSQRAWPSCPQAVLQLLALQLLCSQLLLQGCPTRASSPQVVALSLQALAPQPQLGQPGRAWLGLSLEGDRLRFRQGLVQGPPRLRVLLRC